MASAKASDDVFVFVELSPALTFVLEGAQGHCGVGAIREVRGMFELIEPLFLLFVKVGGLENGSALVEENHERHRSWPAGRKFPLALVTLTG